MLKVKILKAKLLKSFKSHKSRTLITRIILSGVAGGIMSAIVPNAYAQQTGKPAQPMTAPTASSKPPTGGGTGTAAPMPAASATMQLRREISGNFLCRFVTPADASAPLVALPAPLGADNILAVPVPSTLKAKDALLEVVDTDHSRVARVPVVTSGVTSLNDNSFTLVQTVLVPVTVKGKGGLTSATVTLASDDKTYKQSVTLTPADAGTARFTNVPLKKQITATVTEGANGPVSASQTLTIPTSAEGYKWTPAFEVNWPAAHFVPFPAAAAPAIGANGVPGTPISPVPSVTPAAPPLPAVTNNSESPLSGIVSTVVSLLFLGGVGYGFYWAFQNGHLKNLLDKLGIQTQPMTAGGPQTSPFDKPQKTPIQSITDGTADPLAGGSNFAGGAGFTAAPIASAGPRLVGTMGTYAGSIFPLTATAMDIGRDANNPIPMPNDTNASRRHATVQLTGGQATVTDNGSSNGTFVNGVRIPAQNPHTLRPGDEVQIGMTRFRFEG